MTSACADHDPGRHRPSMSTSATHDRPRDNPALIRAALLRKALADARQRAALGRRLGLTHNEVLALQYVARAGTTRSLPRPHVVGVHRWAAKVPHFVSAPRTDGKSEW
jgi:hypothetical protein